MAPVTGKHPARRRAWLHRRFRSNEQPCVVTLVRSGHPVEATVPQVSGEADVVGSPAIGEHDDVGLGGPHYVAGALPSTASPNVPGEDKHAPNYRSVTLPVALFREGEGKMRLGWHPSAPPNSWTLHSFGLSNTSQAKPHTQPWPGDSPRPMFGSCKRLASGRRGLCVILNFCLCPEPLQRIDMFSGIDLRRLHEVVNSLEPADANVRQESREY